MSLINVSYKLSLYNLENQEISSKTTVGEVFSIPNWTNYDELFDALSDYFNANIKLAEGTYAIVTNLMIEGYKEQVLVYLAIGKPQTQLAENDLDI